MKKNATRLVALFLLVQLAGEMANAVVPEKAITQYNQVVWTAANGLPQNSISSIIQTRDGYLWLGTEEGLVRFDGRSFTVFDKSNNKVLGNNSIESLLESRDGSLWIGTNGGGLSRYKDGIFTTYTSQNGLSENYIGLIYEGRDGSVWISTNGDVGGLNRFKDGEFTSFNHKDGLPNQRIRALVEDDQGGIWIGTKTGLARFEKGQFASFNEKDGLPGDQVNTIYQDKQGILWIGTDKGLGKLQGGKFITQRQSSPIRTICEGADGSIWVGTYYDGLDRFRDGVTTTFKTQDGLPSNVIMRVQTDREGSLWVTTDAGIARFRDERFTKYTKQEGLPSTRINRVFEDREGNLWIGTMDSGLIALRDGKVTAFGTPEGLSADFVWCVYEGHDGSIWIGTEEGGINRFKDGKLTHLTMAGLPSNSISSVYESNDRSLWIGTRDRISLNQLKNGKLRTYTALDGLAAGEIATMLEDHSGNLWVGTSDGLSRFKDGKFITYSSKEGLLSNKVRAIHESPDGSLWIGTFGGGLNRFDGRGFTAYTTKEGLSTNNVISIYEDRNGVLWIGTSNGGLNRYKDGKFTPYTTDEGLFNDTVFSIVEDDSGYLWMSCNKGIFQVSKQELNDYAEGKIRRITSTSYGAADGMRSGECNGRFNPSVSRTKDGRLWFPTVKGLAMIDPNHLIHNAVVPPVVIEQVLYDKKLVSAKYDDKLPPGRGELEFHFTALSFVCPEQMRFKYKLEGLDSEWTDPGLQRAARYTNLPPGRYRFRVLASNNDGVWNEVGATFDFDLQAHFYQSKWFYALCVLAIILLVFGLYGVRMHQLRRRTRDLERVVDQRTGELKVEQQKVLKLEKLATEQQMAGGFAHEMRNALAGSKLLLDQALALDGPEPRVSLNLANCRGLKEIYLELKDDLPEKTTQVILGKMQKIFANEERLTEVMQLVRKATGRGLNITQQIMDYSKVGKQQPGQQSVDLHNLIFAVVNESREEFNSQGVVIAYEPGDQLLTLTGDETHFYSIIKNIVLNARDALIDPAVNDRENRRIEITTALAGGDCSVVVADNGIGIPPENLKKVFEPFFSTKPATGTGLGLGMVKKMVALYNGNVEVSSHGGKGTSITISLPVSQ
jgi:ligand-binding sensor domain-containing protein/signal transduction histidine kinase